MSASVSWSCYCLLSQFQQHITGYLGVTDVFGGRSGARGRQWVLFLWGHLGQEVMTEPSDLLWKNEIYSMFCGRQDTLKVHFILCQQRSFFLVHNPLPQLAAL